MPKKVPTNAHSQQRIDEIQAIYREWLALQPKLEQAEKDWKKSVKLMEKLEDFYLQGEYRAIFDKLESGENLDLTTEGEYSVMSEDAIWNAMHDQQQQLWQLLRFAVKNLDKQENDNLR